MKELKKFKKIFGIDTNIIIDNHQHIFKLSEKGENLIIISKTVLQELDNLKTKGNDFIRYEIRRFQEIINKNMKVIKKLSIGTIIKVNSKYNSYIFLYNDPNSTIYEKNYNNNDEKIIAEYKEIFNLLKYNSSTEFNKHLFVKEFNKEEDFEIVSNDLLFRTIGISEGLNVKPLLANMYDPNIELETEVDIEEVLGNNDWFKAEDIKKYIENKLNKLKKEENENNEEIVKLEEILKNFDRYSYIKMVDGQSHPWILQRYDKNTFKVFNGPTYNNILGIKPRNSEQSKALEIMLNPNNDIVVLEGIAGTAKTLTALLAALKLKKIDNRYKNIYYIRKTLISGNKLDEIGFLPGALEEKLMGYLYPLKDNIELLIRIKNKKEKNISKDKMEELVKEFENNNNIQYLYQGHLRGGNLQGIVILDEAQNFSIQDIRLILSRMQENTKVFVLGSIAQIDNPYLTKENNSLTYMLNKCGVLKENVNDKNVQIQGLRLKKVERGPIANWIEHQFEI